MCVSHDDEALTVTYDTAAGWQVTETHLAVGPTLDAYRDEGWLNRADNPRPGHLPYSDHHAPRDTVSVTIPLDDLDGFGTADEVLVAAHAVVIGDEGVESAWGEGPRFRDGGNWAMYFAYELP